MMKKRKPFYTLFIFSFLIYIQITAQSQLSNDDFIASEIKSYTALRDTHPKLAIEKFVKLRNKIKKSDRPDAYKKITYQLIYIYTNSYRDFNKAIEETRLGEKIAKETKDFDYLTQMHQIRGISYIELGLSEQGLAELKTALEYTEKIPDSPDKHMTVAIIYDNIGGYYETKKDFDNFKKYKKQSLLQAWKIKEGRQSDRENKYSIIASQYANLGHIHFTDKNLDSAQYYFNESYKIIQENKDVIPIRMQADICDRLSWLYYERKEFDASINYAHQGLNLLKKSSNSEVKKSLYQILYLSYLETNQIDSSKMYSDLFLKLNDSIAFAAKANVNSEMKKILKENKSRYHNNIFRIIIIFLLVSTIIFFGIYLRTIRYRKKYVNLLNKITKEEKQNIDEIQVQENVEGCIQKTNSLMTDDTKNVLIKKIEKFEKSEKFIRRGLTIITIAHEMNTNTTYLSTVIKEVKNKNFNNYLNGLRIEYIVNLLHKDPKYREYKTSYLAEVCGFSSREVFTTVFKKETGISPSYFIKRLKQENISEFY